MGRAADDAGGSLRFLRHRVDFRLHLLAVAQHPRQIAERLGEIAAGLLLDRHGDAEEIGFRKRHAFIEFAAGLTQRHADGLRVENGAEFGFQRLRRFGRDHLQAVKQRQAGLDAAHDDVDGVREGIEKLRFAALLQIGQEPARQSESAGKAKGQCNDRAGAEQDSQQEQNRADARRIA